MLADDLPLILQDLKSVENALKLLNNFSFCSELRINIEKNIYRNNFNIRSLSAWFILDQNTP